MATGWAAWAALFCSGTLGAQTLIPGSGLGGEVRLLPADETVLDAGQARQNLPCTVTPVKPELGFDLRFHAGYAVSLPMNEVGDEPNTLTMVFRVTPKNAGSQPAHFLQRVPVPALNDPGRGVASIEGWFDLGEGDYHVDWLMRDDTGRVCAANWEVEASRRAKDKGLALDLPAGGAAVSERDGFPDAREPEATSRNGPLRVSVVANVAPQDSDATTLRRSDLQGLAGILRVILRDPSIGKLSLVAANVQSEQVLYRQHDSVAIDLWAVGKAVKSLELATVDLRVLGRKHGEAEFLVNLIQEEIRDRHPDALIVVSPKVVVDGGTPRELLDRLGEAGCPLFYMNYNPETQDNPWRDMIGTIVKRLRGVEYTIRWPRDVVMAWSQVAARLPKPQLPQSASATGRGDETADAAPSPR
jgi:hypothetical protein